ncbi:hypothetical protein ACIA8O_25420 [Kitasatospora sp. NPDC051853]|uniref:hypothetical protein n=1 Tax=Kitasatospora sp. NPDC051853 TaxID=3364058 RepID=UPI00379F5FA1
MRIKVGLIGAGVGTAALSTLVFLAGNVSASGATPPQSPATQVGTPAPRVTVAAPAPQVTVLAVAPQVTVAAEAGSR